MRILLREFFILNLILLGQDMLYYYPYIQMDFGDTSLLADSTGELFLSLSLSLSLLSLGIKRFAVITKREQARAKAKQSSSVISQKGKSSGLSRPLSADGKVRKDIIITYTNSSYLNLSYILIYPYTLNGNLAFHE